MLSKRSIIAIVARLAIIFPVCFHIGCDTNADKSEVRRVLIDKKVGILETRTNGISEFTLNIDSESTLDRHVLDAIGNLPGNISAIDFVNLQWSLETELLLAQLKSCEKLYFKNVDFSVLEFPNLESATRIKKVTVISCRLSNFKQSSFPSELANLKVENSVIQAECESQIARLSCLRSLSLNFTNIDISLLRTLKSDELTSMSLIQTGVNVSEVKPLLQRSDRLTLEIGVSQRDLNFDHPRLLIRTDRFVRGLMSDL